MTEIERPTVVRRRVSFAEAVFDGSTTVEGVTARLAHNLEETAAMLGGPEIPILVDPDAETALRLKPVVVIDAVMAKRNLGTALSNAPLVIGVGPGFRAGIDVAAVVETQRGHDLGRVILEGSAEPNTGVPGKVGGFTTERVLRAPADGTFTSATEIGHMVGAGDGIGAVDGALVVASVSGIVRGLLRDGLAVRTGQKLGDIDPRGIAHYCFTISDKARAVAGGVLTAVLSVGGQSIVDTLG
jgi:xanthine dehydrogenase accessory factor